MPSRRPLHIRGPPESPCRSARQIRDDDDVYEVGIVHINKTVNEPELAKKLLSACQLPGLGMVLSVCKSLSVSFIYYFGPDWYISSTRFIMTFYSDIHSPRSFLVATQGFDFDSLHFRCWNCTFSLMNTWPEPVRRTNQVWFGQHFRTDVRV